MDFIERLFGVAPDGGSGWLEVTYLLAAGFIVGWFLWRRQTSINRQ